jgi:1,3-alpha-isomaltosidase
MMRHRPFGSEHPYATTDDQRVPPRPMVGEPVELRVRTDTSTGSVVCEWQGTRGPEFFELHRVTEASAAHSASGTHLAAAAAAHPRGGAHWSVVVPPLETGGLVRYRFEGVGEDSRRTRSRWFTFSAAGWSREGGQLRTVGRDRVVADSVRWLVDAGGVRRVRFALALEPGEHVVGFGERFDRLDQRGHRIDAVVFEQYKGQAAAGRTYLPMPFAHVLGGSGWGFHVRTSRRTWFDVAESDSDRLWVEADLGGATEESLEIAIYDGQPSEVLAAFLAETGAPRALPSWVHRLWASGNEWNTQERVIAEIDRHHGEEVPVGVVVIEAWSDESTFAAFRDAVYEPRVDGSPHQLADFTFPARGAWPDPKGMVDKLHEQAVKVLLWQIPLQKMRPHPSGQARADADAMLARDLGVKESDGRPYRNRGWWFPLALMPDFTNAEAREWWLAKRRYLVDEVGIDGFKTDGGEHAWGHDLRYADGRRGDDGNNLYPVHYAAAYGELLEQAGKAPVTFSRAGFTDSAAHGCFWAGDEDSTWEAYRASITAGLTASACGVTYWGWDLGGFSGPIPSAELYLRSAAAACFAPIMQYHSEFNHHRSPSRDRTPWNIAEQTGDDQVLPIFRRFAQLRERLVPYLSEQTSAGIASGWSLMRSLGLVYPHDEQAWAHPTQYLLGDSLLICPITEADVTTWPCYLPTGEWVDVWTGDVRAGGETVVVVAPLDRIPVWCRAVDWERLKAIF